jgi:hypothetical protein
MAHHDSLTNLKYIIHALDAVVGLCCLLLGLLLSPGGVHSHTPAHSMQFSLLSAQPPPAQTVLQDRSSISTPAQAGKLHAQQQLPQERVTSGTSTGSWRRELQQAQFQSVNNRELPR